MADDAPLGHAPWTDDERAEVADRLRLDMTCSGIGRLFGLSKKETVRRIVADDELRALRPQLRGINPQQHRPKSRTHVTEKPRSIVQETPIRTRRAAVVDPLLVQHKADLALADDPPMPPMTVLPISGMRLVSLADLERGECKWPVEERDDVVGKILFCGKATRDGASYCKAHTFAALPAQRRAGAR